MPDQLQLRGGTTTEHNSFTGVAREVTVDTTKKTLVVHDGSQAGGTPLMKESGTVDPTTITIGTGGTQRLAISNTEVVFNETGANVDFRVEGDTYAHLLFADASTDRIGLGTNSPETLLHAKVNTFSDDINKVALTLSNNQSSGVHQYFQNASTGTGVSNGARIGLGNTDNFLIQHFEDKDIQISTNGLERMRLLAGGNLLLGSSSNLSIASGTTGLLQLTRTSGAVHQSVNLFTNDNSGGIIAFGKSRGTSAGSYTVVQDNDEIGVIRFAGADGSDLVSQAASIAAKVDGTPGSNDMPGRLEFGTTSDGAAEPTTRMTITNAGHVGIGTSPNQLFHVNGQARVGTLGVNQDAGSSTLGVNGNISISPSGNTSYQKFTIDGSQVTAGSKLTVNNYGDIEGDYYFFGVNATLNSSGSNIKTNDAKRHAGLYLDGRMGSVMFTSSQTSTSTINNHYTFDRNGNFSLAGNVVVATSGAGIDFSATTNNGTSELFDDYEEGTFTPTLSGSTATGTISYIYQKGDYTKKGNAVTIAVTLAVNDIGNSSGDMRIGGLPYSVLVNSDCVAAVQYNSLGTGLPSGREGPAFALLQGNYTTILQIRVNDSTNANYDPLAIQTVSYLRFSVTYLAN